MQRGEGGGRDRAQKFPRDGGRKRAIEKKKRRSPGEEEGGGGKRRGGEESESYWSNLRSKEEGEGRR